MNRPNVVSLFSGAGGLDLGLAASGFDILFESDIDKPSCVTLEKNGAHASKHGLDGFGSTVVQCADVNEISGSEILASIGKKRFEVDLLAGGPPCQAFSISGLRRGILDKRGLLVFEYARILSEIAPKSFVFENVYGLLTIDGGKVFEEVLVQLETPSDGMKYNIYWQRVNARDFAVPQSRDRVIIMGIRSDIDVDASALDLIPITSGDATTGLMSWRTVKYALQGLPVPVSRKSPLVANHYGRDHGLVVSERYGLLAPGERDSKTRINRLDVERPSYTIVVGSDNGGGKGHVHPFEPREITPRESARMQTFPDWWAFSGNVRDAIRQVGNAVPTLLGFAIGNRLREVLFGLNATPLPVGAQRLGQGHLLEMASVTTH